MFTSGIIYALLTALALGIWTVAHNVVTQEVESALVGAVLISLIAVLFGIASLLYYGNLFDVATSIKTVSIKGFLFIALAGLMALLIDTFAIKAYSYSGTISIVAPIIMSGSIVVSTCIGIFFLGEMVTLYKVFGISSTVIGVILLSL